LYSPIIKKLLVIVESRVIKNQFKIGPLPGFFKYLGNNREI
jgi:hypothetical protein